MFFALAPLIIGLRGKVEPLDEAEDELVGVVAMGGILRLVVGVGLHHVGALLGELELEGKHFVDIVDLVKQIGIHKGLLEGRGGLGKVVIEGVHKGGVARAGDERLSEVEIVKRLQDAIGAMVAMVLGQLGIASTQAAHIAKHIFALIDVVVDVGGDLLGVDNVGVEVRLVQCVACLGHLLGEGCVL